jgi:hypothetical protein
MYLIKAALHHVDFRINPDGLEVRLMASVICLSIGYLPKGVMILN